MKCRSSCSLLRFLVFSVILAVATSTGAIEQPDQTAAKPPLKAIVDPFSLRANPQLKLPIETKPPEEYKPQRLKAIRYVCQIYCSCEERVEEEVQRILVQQLANEDADIRLCVAQSVARNCNSKCNAYQDSRNFDCLRELLYARAYGHREDGSFIESSSNVRDACKKAIVAMNDSAQHR